MDEALAPRGRSAMRLWRLAEDEHGRRLILLAIAFGILPLVGLTATVNLSATPPDAEGFRTFTLLFRAGKEVIAQRTYRDGKVTRRDGTIPDDLEGCVTSYVFGGAGGELRHAYRRNGQNVEWDREKAAGLLVRLDSEGGRIVSVGTWEKGRPHGPRIAYAANGQVAELTVFENGRRIGTDRSYYDSGAPRAVRRWSEKGACQVMYYREDGTLDSESSVSKGELHVEKHYDAAGKAVVRLLDPEFEKRLSQATRADDPEAVKALLRERPDRLTMKDRLGCTLLHDCCNSGHAQVVRLLLGMGAAPSATNVTGGTPIQYAAARGHEGIVAQLVAARAAVNSHDRIGATPLHHAALHGRVAAIKALLAGRAAVDSLDKMGSSPLHFAAIRGHLDAVKALVEGGADIGLRSKVGTTAMLLAKDGGNAAIISYLAQAERRKEP